MEVEPDMSQIGMSNNCVYDWCSMLTYEQENTFLSMNNECENKHHVFHFYSGDVQPTPIIRKLTKEGRR